MAPLNWSAKTSYLLLTKARHASNVRTLKAQIFGPTPTATLRRHLANAKRSERLNLLRRRFLPMPVPYCFTWSEMEVLDDILCRYDSPEARAAPGAFQAFSETFAEFIRVCGTTVTLLVESDFETAKCLARQLREDVQRWLDDFFDEESGSQFYWEAVRLVGEMPYLFENSAGGHAYDNDFGDEGDLHRVEDRYRLEDVSRELEGGEYDECDGQEVMWLPFDECDEERAEVMWTPLSFCG